MSPLLLISFLVIAPGLTSPPIHSSANLEFAAVPITWKSRYLQSAVTWEDLRISVKYNDTSVPPASLIELRESIIPTVARWYQHVLQVPPLTTSLIVPQMYCGQAVVPASDRSVGVQADVVIYVLVIPSKYQVGNSEYYGAPCLLSDTTPQRVLAGSIWITMDYFNSLPYHNRLELVARLFANVLAFNSVLYPHFNKPDGSSYSPTEVIQTSVLGGIQEYVMTLPTVLERARVAFNCLSLPGVRLDERAESDQYFLSHWSARMMLNDFMSDLVIDVNAGFSDITMAVFQDSGWYSVQWEYTNSVQFGRNRGCDIMTSACISNQTAAFPEFCVNQAEFCGPLLTTRGNCSLRTYPNGVPSPYPSFPGSIAGPVELDYCPIVAGGESCLEGISTVEGEDVCPECRCFEGQYEAIGGLLNPRNTHCQHVTCVNGTAYVTVGNNTVACPADGGLVSIPNYTGQMLCPPAALVCSSAPCKNLCSGLGLCVDGSCLCDTGYSGVDCSISCHYTCDVCTGSNATQCTTCRRGASLSPLTGICTCESGLTMNAQGYCMTNQVVCDVTCNTCSGPSHTDCTSCRTPAFLSSLGNCVCPDGQTLSTAGICVDCDPVCRGCQYPDTDVCTSCYADLSLASSAPYCNCPLGEYFDAVFLMCLPCDQLCVSCTGASKNCTSCISGFVVANNTCACPIGSSNYVNTTSCASCSSTCKTCAGPSDVECSSCYPGGFFSNFPGRCSCRDKKSVNCTQCVVDKACASCTPPDTSTCTSCYPNANLDPFSKICTCADGFFPNTDASQCTMCQLTCKTCFGALANTCLSCPQNSTLFGNTCVCNAEFFLNLTTQRCDHCSDTHCNNCANSGYCESCDYGFNFTTDHVCQLMEGYYYDNSTNAAYQCPTNCNICAFDMHRTMVCTECLSTFTLLYNNTVCACAPGQYFSSFFQQCYNCTDPRCLECSSDVTCSLCNSTYIPYFSACVCPSNTFDNGTACVPCASDCLTCSGPSAGDCTSCPFYSHDDKGYCMCNDWAIYISNHNCRWCSPNCASCDSANLDVCRSCGSLATLVNQNCTCIPGYAPNPYAMKCSLCDVGCKTCSGMSDRKCTVCYDNSSPNNGNCPCPDGYALSGDWCRPCDWTCETCSGLTNYECSSCFPSGQLDHGTCSCYPTITIGAHCTPCSWTCLNCGDHGECISCYNGAYIAPGSPNECVCLSNYYPNVDVRNCSICHMYCAECFGPAEDQCTGCYYPKVVSAIHTCDCPPLSVMTRDHNCFITSFFCANEHCTACKDPVAINSNFTDQYGDMYGSCSCPLQSQNQYWMKTYPFWWPFQYLLDLEFNVYPDSYLNYPTYYADVMEGKCQKCYFLCTSCDQDPDICRGCFYPSQFVPLGQFTGYGTCHCQLGFYPSEEYRKCAVCPEGCLACESAQVCSSCIAGYEFVIAQGQASCQCAATACNCKTAACKCPGQYLLRSLDICENLCPSGFADDQNECMENATKFTFNLNTINQVVTDSTGQFVLTSQWWLGNYWGWWGCYGPTPVPVYQRGLWFQYSWNQQCLAIGYQNPIILAPTHYFEAWTTAEHLIVARSPQYGDFYPQCSQEIYNTGALMVTLLDPLGNYISIGLPNTLQLSSQWTLLRYEVDSVLLEAGIVTYIRTYQDNVLLQEKVALGAYFQECSTSNYTFVLSAMSFTSASAFVYEITIANQPWTSAPAIACGCPFCTSEGYCIANCTSNEYMLANGTCAACAPGCPYCARGSDCATTADPLCMLWTDFQSCNNCSSAFAKVVRGKCTCVEHSSYIASNNTCVCDPNYIPSDSGLCVMCLNYLSPEDVSVTIDIDLSGMVVNFQSLIMPLAGNPEDCSLYFAPETFKKLGEESTCKWKGRIQLTVQFGTHPTLVAEEVSLNSSNLLKIQGPCSLNLQPLLPIANFSAPIPVPVAVVTGPATVRLGCSSSSVELNGLGSSKGIAKTLLYSWSITQSSSTNLFPEYANYSSDTGKIDIPTDTLQVGTLTVLLSVINEYGSVTNATLTISLVQGRSLLLAMDTGTNIIMKTTDHGAVQAVVQDSCGQTGTRSFVWKYVGAGSTLPSTANDPTLVLQGSSVPYVLMIQKGALTAGYSYTYEVTAQIGAVNGTAQVTITVILSPLALRFNRMSGNQPSDLTLRIDGILSNDPDNLPGSLTFNWTCANETSVCLDASGYVLLTDPSTAQFAFAPTLLILNSVYNFTLTISKDTRSASSSLIITVVEPTGCNIVIKPVSGNITNQQDFSLIPSIDTGLQTDFFWVKTVGPAVVPATPWTYPYIAFKAYSLLAGNSYTFSLTGVTVTGTINAQFSFYVNQPPTGGNTGVKPATGVALFQVFLLYTEYWEDPEGNYPLNYQFCLIKGTSAAACLTSKQLTQWYNTKLFTGNLTVIGRAFDSLGSMSQSNSQVLVSGFVGRQLADNSSTLMQSFMNDTQDPENTIAMIITYSESMTLDQPFFTLIVTSLSSYISALNNVTSQVLDSFLGAVESLATQTIAVEESNAQELMGLINSTVVNCDSNLNFQEMQRIIAVVTSLTGSLDANRQAAKNLVNSLLVIYNSVLLPNQATFQYSTPVLETLTRRVTGSILNQWNFTSGNISISVPIGWLGQTSVASSDVIDVYLSGLLPNSSLAWVVELSFLKVGNYSNYNVQLGDSVPLLLTNLPVPFNVTIPTQQSNSTLECIGLNSNGVWVTDVCKIVEVKNNSVVVTTSSITSLSVRMKLPETTPESTQLPGNKENCEINPVPMAVAAGVVLITAIATALRLLLGKKAPSIPGPVGIDNTAIDEGGKSREMLHHPVLTQLELEAGELRVEQALPEDEGCVAPHQSQDLSQAIEKMNSPPELMNIQGGHNDETSTRLQLKQPMASSNALAALCKNHLVLSVIFESETTIFTQCLLVFLCLLEVFVLGLCYFFWYVADQTASSAYDIFSSYSSTDLGYVGVALAVGTIPSTAMQVWVWTKRGVRVKVGCGLCVALSVALLGAIAYLNAEMCYLAGGLWGESIIWTVLLQGIVLESVKSVGFHRLAIGQND